MPTIPRVADFAPSSQTWFRDALSVPKEHRYTSVSGCQISYWRWGEGGGPGMVLVHGGGAHAHWWDHIAPLLATPRRTVAAVDLSGHGDSGHRSAYSLEGWAAEILAVAEDAQFDGPPILAGHSLGGWSTVVAAADHPGAVSGLILIDTRIVDPPSGGPPEARDRTLGPARVYTTLEEALSRYRVEPAQGGNLADVMEHLALTSARQVESGWTWKFDPRAIFHHRPGAQALRRIACRVAIIRGERGLVTAAITDEMQSALGDRAPVIDVPLAGHHLMLDQPLSLVTALRSALAVWDVPTFPSEPRPRG